MIWANLLKDSTILSWEEPTWISESLPPLWVSEGSRARVLLKICVGHNFKIAGSLLLEYFFSHVIIKVVRNSWWKKELMTAFHNGLNSVLNDFFLFCFYNRGGINDMGALNKDARQNIYLERITNCQPTLICTYMVMVQTIWAVFFFLKCKTCKF